MAGNVVRATLIADARQFKSGFKDAEKATDGFEGKIGKTAGLAKGLLAGAAAAAVVAFAKDSIRAFSELEQSVGSVESVFGSAADDITSRARSAAGEFGLSMDDFNQSAATLGAQLKNVLGLSAEEAAGQVTDLIAKASDMAATFGGTTSDAISAIGSLMRGERDPIEKYGVSMNEAAIQARALELGLADSTGELDAQAKSTAALDLLNEQTADSTGQFADESDTLAGKQQRLNAQIENSKALLGQGLAPVFGVATDAAGGLWRIVGDVGAALAELTGQISAADQVIRNAAEGWDSNTTAGQRFTDVVEGSITQMGHWDQAGEAFIGENQKATEALNLTTEELVAMRDQLPAIAQNLDLTSEAEDSWTTAINRAIISQKQEEDQLAENEARLAAMEGATDDAAGATDELTTAMRDQFDLIDGRLDTFGNLTQAVDDQAAAQAEVNRLIDEGKEGTPEYLTALENLSGAHRDVKDAELGVVEAGGMTRNEFIKQQTAMGLSIDQANQLADKYDLLFTPRSVNHTINYTENFRTKEQRQHGGPVHKGVPYLVGETGPEVMVPSQNGRIVPNGKLGSASAGAASVAPIAVYNITIHAGLGSDPNAISKALVEALQRYERANGVVPIRTRP